MRALVHSKGIAMTRDISWINEIKNNTNEAFVIWCWDTDNEGEFKDWTTGKLVGRNDGGAWVTIKPGAHLVVTGCGIPDGGDKDNKPKGRVICARSKIPHSNQHQDPGRGLRLNRVMGPNQTDRLVYRDHDTTRELASIDFARGLEQNLILTIDDDGIKVTVKEEKESTEWKAYRFGVELGKFLASTLQEIATLALQAAMAA